LSRRRAQVVLSRPLSLGTGRQGCWVFVPFFHRTRFGGFIVGVLDFQKLFSSIVETDPAFNLSIQMNSVEVYRVSDGASYETVWKQEDSLALFGASGRIEAWPAHPFFAERISWLPTLVLGAGGLVSLLLALTVLLI